MWEISSIKELWLEVTSHCNARCPQCGRFDIFGKVLKDLNLVHLDFNLIDKLPIEKMINLEKIVFNGNYGDPLMHPEIDTFIEKFKKIKKIDIHTNGSIRDTMWWKNLGNYKNISVTFAIDGLEDTHILYRRNTNFKKILKNAKNYIENGGDATWQFIIFEHNQHQTDLAKNLSKQLGFKYINFLYSDRFLKNKEFEVYQKNKTKYVLRPAKEQETIHMLSQSKEGELYTKNLFQKKKINNILGKIECPWAKNSKIFISHTGLVLPCCFMANVEAGKPIYKKLFEKIIGSYDLINLNHYMFEDIINSPTLQKFLPESIKNKPHPNCIEHCSPNLSRQQIKDQERKLLNT